jgi:asparagine synthase (glutamine-hydrolysing)
MCGLAGIATTVPDASLSRKAFAATRALHHRGPDETGFLAVRNGVPELLDASSEPVPAEILAGSCRLSIVDLLGGHQPLANETGSVWVTYNGEIYNQSELRAELESLGHRFKTHADTEVLVHGWEEWHTGLLPRLNGIFAFALFDVHEREVVLARDPLGVKPLYLGIGAGHTWWSSELAAAVDAGLCARTLSSEALRLFLTFRFIPSPYAIWANTWKLPPASYVRLRTDALGEPPRFETYSTSIRSSLDPRGKSEWKEALMTELEQSVTRQLASDVPIASLLSGGIDSTLTTLFMAEHLPEPPAAFGVGFASDGDRSEELAGALAAHELGVPYHSRTLLDAEYDEGWPSLVARMGEPTGNTSAAILHSICVDVGKTHKVGLCGQGADELLGGYPRHVAERLYPLGSRAPQLAGSAAGALFGDGAGPRLTRVFGTDDRLDRYVGIFAHVTPAEADRLVPADAEATLDLARRIVSRWTSESKPRDTVNELLRVDARVSLPDDLLMVADLCSMYESVELRVPFLDLAFVELAERMPSRYKIGLFGNRKWLYREAAATRLPTETSRRLGRTGGPLRRKRGFSPPGAGRAGGGHGASNGEPGWLAPLLALDAFDEKQLRLAASGGGDGHRRRAVLQALSGWLTGQDA